MTENMQLLGTCHTKDLRMCHAQKLSYSPSSKIACIYIIFNTNYIFHICKYSTENDIMT